MIVDETGVLNILALPGPCGRENATDTDDETGTFPEVLMNIGVPDAGCSPSGCLHAGLTDEDVEQGSDEVFCGMDADGMMAEMLPDECDMETEEGAARRGRAEITGDMAMEMPYGEDGESEPRAEAEESLRFNDMGAIDREMPGSDGVNRPFVVVQQPSDDEDMDVQTDRTPRTFSETIPETADVEDAAELFPSGSGWRHEVGAGRMEKRNGDVTLDDDVPVHDADLPEPEADRADETPVSHHVRHKTEADGGFRFFLGAGQKFRMSINHGGTGKMDIEVNLHRGDMTARVVSDGMLAGTDMNRHVAGLAESIIRDSSGINSLLLTFQDGRSEYSFRRQRWDRPGEPPGRNEMLEQTVSHRRDSAYHNISIMA